MRVLQVEDSTTDAKLVLQALRSPGVSLEAERVEDAASLRAALERQPWDIVISDWSMPKFSALAALEIVKSSGLDLPFIIVSGTVGEEMAVEAMRAGAHDYVLKDKLARLRPAVERELREHADRRARRAAEENARLSEARFRRLADSGVVSVVIADVHGNIHDANDTYLRLTGYTRDELLAGRVRWADMTPPDQTHLAARALEQLAATGVAPPLETEQLRKDGSRVPVLATVAMLDFPHCIAVVVDLSERKKGEAALARMEEQFRQAQKMEAIGSLAGGVAHDFNNVLSVILSYSEMILGELKPSDPLRGDIEQIRTAGKRAAELTRQLLLFSRQQVVEPKVLDLNAVLLGMDKMLRRILGEDVDLVSTPDPGLGRVQADPGSIEQVVMNLVVNARDAMPTGGKLTMETSNVELDEEFALEHHAAKPGRYVMLAVSDTGIGMDKPTRARIFEPFFTTKETGKGTGLGLSTVFGIVQQSGGHLWVYSEVGKGTTFKIYLPRVDAAVEQVRKSIAVGSLRGSETIVLVEDEEQVRTVARDILRKHGYRVFEASNAGEALLLFEKHQGSIHLLLTDVVMPLTSGPELAKRLRAKGHEMKVLYMSGYTDDAALRHGVVESGIAYLQKPLTVETLTRKVREVLDS